LGYICEEKNGGAENTFYRRNLGRSGGLNLTA